ncbi:MAG TPA: NRDE family protein, partial [Pyrinomonadaceae bacterium]|nr:NRDE family protein [Pyrinomonadaceae bacterium]
MCTLSWIHREDGYLLLFNRDELRTRKPASAPRIEQRNGVEFIAPLDGDHGGSWIAVNQFGLTLCLLNRFDDSPGGIIREYTSRGLLLHELTDCSALKTVTERVDDAKCSRFRPFTLVALVTGQPAMVIEWTGSETITKSHAENFMPITSSSLQEGNVVLKRKRQFQEMVLARSSVDDELLFEFHRSHLPERGPASVCMHRPDARTVSMSTLTVTQKAIEFVYHPNSPCQPAMADRL